MSRFFGKSRIVDSLINRRMVSGTIFVVILSGMLLASCGAESEPTTVDIVLAPTPTLNTLLTGARELRPTAQPLGRDEDAAQSQPATTNVQSIFAQPTVALLFARESQVQVVATPTQSPIVAAADSVNLIALGSRVGQVQAEDFIDVPVYDDQLNSNWTLVNSRGVEFDQSSTARWFDELDPNAAVTSGAMSIALKPTDDYGQLFFTVRSGSTETYYRDEILGISFWMYSGTNILDRGDFAVTVIGSNAQPYWSPTDGSVFFDSDDSFSETPFYDLEINRSVPPDSWVKIEVWLDDLLFDPNYEYITGIYIKNDAGIRNRVFIDQLKLIKFRGA